MVNTVVGPAPGFGIDATLLAGRDLEAEINRLRRERNAVILAHYYQEGEIQDLADFVGDSLDLSRKAAATKADVILFCGVKFMAEVAKIVAPDRTVLLPDSDAGCSLEESCRPEPFKHFRDQHPDHIAVTYINCSAEVKALSDVIVTSSNAEAIIRQLPADKPILFAPDRHLGAYLQRKTGRKMTLWPGSCIVHEQFSERELIKLKSQHPNALVASHPECPEGILLHSDFVGSTTAILNFVNKSDASEFIIGTEQHIIHQMEKHLREMGTPPKIFHSLPGSDGSCNCSLCPFMAKNTIEKIYLALVNNAPRIELPEPLRLAALKPLERMLEMSKGIGAPVKSDAPPQQRHAKLKTVPVSLSELDLADARVAIHAALEEDIGAGDLTSSSVIPADLRFHGVMRARGAMVIAGLPIAREVFSITAPDAAFRALVQEGELVQAGARLAEMEGPARGLLTGERTALNFVQFLTGIATLTHAYAEAVRETNCILAETIRGTNCVLLDTRKTIPGLRRLSKYATRCGGARNHRMGLFDGILIKDNHIAVCGSVAEAVKRAKAAGAKVPVEVECDRLEQVREAVDAGADILLLDNMTPAQLREGVALVRGRAKTEASGGVTLDSIRAIAEAGVDFVSVGRITQSAPAADIGLDWS